MEGRILGNRYELIEKVGGGGMAIVYKAKCKLLNRFVAVKILRPEFVNDEEFTQRFRIEAQAAASLSHPNIVSIYDVGHEGDIQYIVMELIDGITLKDYIDSEGVVQWREAVNVTIQICSAIEHAHKNKIIHRDIKPHNILLTKEGVAKVADFGIARAVSSSTITMAGSTIGSVHYFSPEQARGGYTDEKSDIYSLGVTFYEMMTGLLPFDGDTPVAVALKHIQEVPKAPSEIDPSIPRGINDIIMKAMKKDQNKRYLSAKEMLEDLYKVLRQPNGTFVVGDIPVTNGSTQKVKAISKEANTDYNQRDSREPDENDEMTIILEEEPRRDGRNQYLPKKENGVAKYRQYDSEDRLYDVNGRQQNNNYIDNYSNKQGGSRPKFTAQHKKIMAIVAILIGLGLISFYIGNLLTGQNNASKQFSVGYYLNKNINDVKEDLNKDNFSNYTVTKEESDMVPVDVIISQQPSPNEKILKVGGKPIILVVSTGKRKIKLADYTNSENRIVELELREKGLIPEIREEFNDRIAVNNVIKTDPGAGQELDLGTKIIIYKSLGPEIKKTIVPNLIGKTRPEALKVIYDAKLKFGKATPDDVNDVVKKVIRQSPEPNTQVNVDSAIELFFEETPIATPTASNEMKTVNVAISLNSPETYQDKITILAEIKVADATTYSVLVNKRILKTEFPYTVNVPVKVGNATKLKISLDGIFYNEVTVQ